MTRLIDAELIKLTKRQLTKNLAFVLIGIVVIFYLVLLAVSKQAVPARGGGVNAENLLGLQVAIPFSLNIMSFFGMVLAVIFAGSSMGSEYGWRTIRTIVISSESRTKLLGAKLVSVVALVFIGMLIGVVAGFVMSLITTAIGHYSFSFSFFTASYAWQQFVQFWRTFLVLMPYVFLAFLFGVVGRSALSGIAVGIGLLIAELIIDGLMRAAGGWVAKIPNYLLFTNVDAMTALNKLPRDIGGGPGAGNSAVLPGAWHAGVVLVLYCILFIGLAFYTFQKRDVTS